MEKRVTAASQKEIVIVTDKGQITKGKERADVMKAQKFLCQATVAQTLGPHYQHIFWIRTRPLCLKPEYRDMAINEVW